MNVWRNSDGKVIRNADGLVVRCDDCPCVECPDVDELTVTLSGIAACTCIVSGATSSKLTAISLNGVHTVTQTAPGSGVWTATVGSWTRTIYSDPACTVVDSTDSGVFTIQVLCFTGPVFDLSVSGGALVDIFTADPAAIGASMPNLTTCDPRYTYDGTATVEL